MPEHECFVSLSDTDLLISISRPTFDVEVERVALAVRHGVGGHAGVEAGRGELD